jgi:hypothetical protein
MRALYDQKAFNDDDLKNAAAAYRLSPRAPRQYTIEENKRDQL